MCGLKTELYYKVNQKSNYGSVIRQISLHIFPKKIPGGDLGGSTPGFVLFNDLILKLGVAEKSLCEWIAQFLGFLSGSEPPHPPTIFGQLHSVSAPT